MDALCLLNFFFDFWCRFFCTSFVNRLQRCDDFRKGLLAVHVDDLRFGELLVANLYPAAGVLWQVSFFQHVLN